MRWGSPKVSNFRGFIILTLIGDKINTSVANFGLIPYGHSIIGSPYFDPENEYACEPYKNPGYHGHETTSPIIIARRGECSFVMKVKNIENASAKLAIIVDEIDNETMDEIIMVDDGTGAPVKIPSIMINKKEGEALLSYYENAGEDERKKISLVTSFDIVRNWNLTFIRLNQTIE